jgi:hypothetical protein
MTYWSIEGYHTDDLWPHWITVSGICCDISSSISDEQATHTGGQSRFQQSASL